MPFLKATRHSHGPAVIAKMLANLTHDGRDGERQEIRSFVDVESLHGLYEPDASNLLQVLERLATPLVPASDVCGQGRHSSMIEVVIFSRLGSFGGSEAIETNSSTAVSYWSFLSGGTAVTHAPGASPFQASSSG